MRGDQVMGFAVRDSRFSFEGRGGFVRFTDGSKRGVLDWEMLVAGDFDIMIYGEQCQWMVPVARKMTRDEVRQLVRQFAAAVPARIDLCFNDGHEDIDPSSKA